MTRQDLEELEKKVASGTLHDGRPDPMAEIFAERGASQAQGGGRPVGLQVPGLGQPAPGALVQALVLGPGAGPPPVGEGGGNAFRRAPLPDQSAVAAAAGIQS